MSPHTAGTDRERRESEDRRSTLGTSRRPWVGMTSPYLGRKWTRLGRIQAQRMTITGGRELP